MLAVLTPDSVGAQPAMLYSTAALSVCLSPNLVHVVRLGYRRASQSLAVLCCASVEELYWVVLYHSSRVFSTSSSLRARLARPNWSAGPPRLLFRLLREAWAR